MKHKVFIYGTLKRGQYFHERFLGSGKANFLGTVVASPDYSLYIDGLPHMIAEPTDTPVKGELYEMDDKVLNSLDELESHPVVYKRELIDVYNESGEKTIAWCYLRSPNFKGKKNSFKESEFV